VKALLSFLSMHGIATLFRGSSRVRSQSQPTAVEAIVDEARQHLDAWNGMTETDPSVRHLLVDYWRTVTGGTHPDVAFGSGWETSVPWSAAFVSYVVDKAAPGTLTPAQGHWTYTKAALNASPGEYHALRPETTIVREGDIVVKNRSGGTMTFDDLSRVGFAPTHGDIVVDVFPDFAVAIGGNVSNSVRESHLPLTDGKALDAIAVLRIQ